jgi:6-pyruvoyltetrahydropterin/6-carboxytetrahydropterin synthase
VTVYLTKRLDFAAAHRLVSPALGEAGSRRLYGPCSRVHGHNYALEVTVRGPVGADGRVMEVAVLERAMRTAVVDLVDHRELERDVPALAGVVTTGENLALAFHRMLDRALPPGLLCRVAVVETEKNRFEVGAGGEVRHGDER